MKTAFVFPGQGAQYVGMGRDLAEQHPVVRQTFEEASDALGRDLASLCFAGPESELVKTANQQPSILTMSVAVWRLLLAEGLAPDIVAGLSLGEYSALVAAGALPFAAAVPLVQRRGQFMQEAVPQGEGAMAALLGLGAQQAEGVCSQAAAERPGWVVAPANYNCPGQLVIAGHTAAVERAVELARAAGAKKAMPLPVSAPFHCSLLAPAGQRLKAELEGLPISNAALPVVANVTARPVQNAAEIRDLQVQQVDHPVRWEESVGTMMVMGAETFIEVGPGTALSGFIKRIDRKLGIMNVGDAASLARVLDSCRRVC